MKIKKYLAMLILVSISLFSIYSQDFDSVSLSVTPEVQIPMFGSEELFSIGGGALAQAKMNLFPWMAPVFEGGYYLYPTLAETTMDIITLGAGIEFIFNAIPRLAFYAGGSGGYYFATYGDINGANYFAKGTTGINYRFNPAFSVSGGVTYNHLFSSRSALSQNIGVTLSAVLNLGGLRGGTNVDIENVEVEPIFPIFYSHYDENSFGSLTLTNNEQAPIENVEISVFVKKYMDTPKVSGSFETISRGDSVEVPLYALFTDQILELTEGSKVAADFIVNYTLLDADRVYTSSQTITVNHRNAMTWDDDRKAAAFVTAKDPAVLRFSKFAAGLIRENGIQDIDLNLRLAMGLFEGLNLLGINYVVDPTTPYEEFSQNSSALDYLQFPSQTMIYRGGDCDDLSICYSATLQSVGISTAFITIPGHIFMAFALDMDEAQIKRQFANPDDILLIEGKAWVPVEVTLLNEGFLKAWQIGAKQWHDNYKDGNAGFFPIETAWTAYDPVGIPGADSRVVLPLATDIIDAYTESLAKFVTRELEPQVVKIREDIASSNNRPRLINRLGVLYARYGQLANAKTEFSRAAGQNYVPSIINLGNIEFLQDNMTEATRYFQRALSLDPDSEKALIGLARTQYELEDYTGASEALASVRAVAPELAAKYSYLESVTNGVGRASSAAAQRGVAEWDDAE